MKTIQYAIRITFILLAFLAIGCTNDDTPKPEPKDHFWKTRHDAIPEQFKGEWVSISDKTEIVLIVTDRYVMTKDFSLNPKEGNAVKIDDRQYNLYQNGHTYTLAFGINEYAGQVTITVDNDCYDTVVPFEPSIPEPEPTQPEPQEPVFN